MRININTHPHIPIHITLSIAKIFRRKDGSLDRFIEIKTTLAQMRRV